MLLSAVALHAEEFSQPYLVGLPLPQFETAIDDITCWYINRAMPLEILLWLFHSAACRSRRLSPGPDSLPQAIGSPADELNLHQQYSQ